MPDLPDDDCFGPQEATLRAAENYQRETRADTYWRVGYLNIAAFCIIPPIAGYLAAILGVIAARWVIRGFK
jgi:hypothetical protein